jgi:hypothetical protein
MRYIKKVLKKETATQSGDPKPKKIKQVYSLRDVIKQIHRDLIEAEIPHKPTDKAYIGSYQRAVTAVHRKMSKTQLKEAEKMVDLWNGKGAPAEVQLK